LAVIPKNNILISSGPIESKASFKDYKKMLRDMGYNIYATKGTYDFMKLHGLPAKLLHWPLSKKSPNVMDYIKQGKIDLVINIPKNYHEEELTNDYLIRRASVDFNIPLITNIQLAKHFVLALAKYTMQNLEIKSWDEY